MNKTEETRVIRLVYDDGTTFEHKVNGDVALILLEFSFARTHGLRFRDTANNNHNYTAAGLRCLRIMAGGSE